MNIYNISPCNTLGDDEELKCNIFNSYLATIKLINFNYQVLINTDKINFEKNFDILNKNTYLSTNNVQRNMIEEYKEYLIKLSKERQIYEKTFYIIVEKLNLNEKKQFEEAFNSMKNLGVSISKIENSDEVFKILYNTINKFDEEVSK